MKGHRCLNCDWLFTHEDAHSYEAFTRDGPVMRFGCPECFSPNIEEMYLCIECQREPCVEGDDLGRNCLAAEADALVDIQLDQFDERSAA